MEKPFEQKKENNLVKKMEGNRIKDGRQKESKIQILFLNSE